MRTLHRVGAVVTAFGLGMAGMVPAADAAALKWRIVNTNTKAKVGTDVNQLHDIAAVGPKNVWAVGDVEVNGAKNRAIAQHWTGRKWQLTKLPAPFGARKNSNSLSTVAASGAKNVWAFGRAGNAHYALRWNGAKWKVARRWGNINASVTGAVVLGPRNVWVFGGDPYGPNNLGTWHFNGSKWQKVATPGFNILTASAVGPKNIWAVVTKPTEHADDGRFVARYDGRAWKLVPTPAIPGHWQDTPAYQAVYARSGKDVWVAGGRSVEVNGETKENPIALRWNGSAWKRFNGPRGRHNVAPLSSIVPDGKGGIWATRGYSGEGDIVRLSAGGKWTVSKLPKVRGKFLGAGELARTPGSSVLWSAGVLKWGGYPSMNGVVLKYSR